MVIAGGLPGRRRSGDSTSTRSLLRCIRTQVVLNTLNLMQVVTCPGPCTQSLRPVDPSSTDPLYRCRTADPAESAAWWKIGLPKSTYVSISRPDVHEHGRPEQGDAASVSPTISGNPTNARLNFEKDIGLRQAPQLKPVTPMLRSSELMEKLEYACGAEVINGMHRWGKP
ncbi:uncharacterized protein LACBIDRAFT_325981 [Laccaria bicolor S238N-H82]|uniref:Predicted protein n=1 Tax=Laccaria bicolor (strain S238N-H82 / ATCC MYA-4686) TaxID=486041 RepID=B0D6W3_LACBS|nr:uncharacterized protein LACBIDRAFT_325981 [Laccaria bicolor S238N-H82]EDR09546.1 predicted protein [Laccaria bicolor S238N-H82]|eukprot:XP_001879895.1 predicted protein [Laccaria bicolor S238N-H82]